jgi:hypothetical protein
MRAERISNPTIRKLSYEGVSARAIYEACKKNEMGVKCNDPELLSIFKKELPPTPFTSLSQVPNSDQLPTVPEKAKQIFESPEWLFWLLAMNEEIETMTQLDVYEETAHPKGELVVGSRWIFTRKIDAKNKRVKRYRARLVAQGFSQVDQVHFDNTWSPVVRWDTLRTMMGIGIAKQYKMRSCDIAKAYLNAKLDFAIYMAKPDGFKNNQLVWSLQRAVYGLKQAGACWYERISTYLTNTLGAEPNDMDPCLFRMEFNNNELGRKPKIDEHAFIMLYVDDIIVSGTTDASVDYVQRTLNNEFQMLEVSKDEIGMLGTRLLEDKGVGLTYLDHTHHIEALIKKYEIDPKSGPKSSPGISKRRLVPNQGGAIKHLEYMTLVGQLQYISNTTRPDVTYCVNSLSRHCNNPGQQHWDAAIRTLKYVANTSDLSIAFKNNLPSNSCITLEAYSDADWSGDLDCYSIGGSVVLLNGSPVMWTSRKQKIIAMSSAESEFIAASTTYRMILWIKQLLDSAGIDHEQPTIHMDSEVALQAIRTGCTSKQMRFINLCYRYVCHGHRNGDFKLQWIKGTENPADLFTKPLDPGRHNGLLVVLGMKRIESRSD